MMSDKSTMSNKAKIYLLELTYKIVWKFANLPHCYANLLEKSLKCSFVEKKKAEVSYSKKVFHFRPVKKKGSFKQVRKQGTLMKICLKWDIKDYVLNALSSKAKTQNEWLCNPRFIPLSTL